MTAPIQEIETQFVLELPEAYRSFVARFGSRATGGLSNALAVAFGLPFGTPVEVRVRYTDRVQLLEANGHAPRAPSPAEVQGVIQGALTALVTVLAVNTAQVDLKSGRVTDA